MAPNARAEPPTLEVPVAIQAGDGRAGSGGTVVVARPALRQRLGAAALRFGVGVVIGAALLPIPLIHLMGIMFFLAMSGLAVNRLLTGRVLRAARGTCPSCAAAADWFVGMGSRRFRFPVVTSCPHCHVRLELLPTAPGALG